MFHAGFDPRGHLNDALFNWDVEDVSLRDVTEKIPE